MSARSICLDLYCRSRRPGGVCDCPPPRLIIPSEGVVLAVLEEAEREDINIARGGAYRLAYAALNAAQDD